jgi:hypothetical protein
MIGGQRITETTRAQAQELLDAASAEFAQIANRSPSSDKNPTASKSSRSAKSARR